MARSTVTTVVVFGAAGYLGRAFMTLTESEFDFIRIGRRPSGEIDHVLDLDRPDDVREFRLDNYPPLDALVFLQGTKPSVATHDITDVHFQSMLRVNVASPAILVSQLQTQIPTGGAVVFCSSVAAVYGSYDPSYASAKSAMRGLAASLARAFPRIRFNMISPGLIADSPVHRGMSADFVARHRARQFDSRLVPPTDVASAIRELIVNRSLQLVDLRVGGWADS